MMRTPERQQSHRSKSLHPTHRQHYEIRKVKEGKGGLGGAGGNQVVQHMCGCRHHCTSRTSSLHHTVVGEGREGRWWFSGAVVMGEEGKYLWSEHSQPMP